MLDQEVNPSEVEPLKTVAGNPELLEVLRRYEDGMHFYSVNDNRKDFVWAQQVSQYSDKVKELFEQYEKEELKSIFYHEDKYTWRHLLKEVENVEINTPELVINEENVTSVPKFSEVYDLTS